MGFLQTQNHDPVLRIKSDAKKTQKFTQNYDPVLRSKSDAKNTPEIHAN